MGMSTHIRAFMTANNDQYQKHKKVLLACLEAGINKLPEETANFFGYVHPDESALEEKLEVNIDDAFTDYSDDMSDGFEVHVKELPPEVEIIRFYNLY